MLPLPSSHNHTMPPEYSPRDPKLWGGFYWNMFFNYASYYPKNPTHQQKLNAKRYYSYFLDKLPCYTCTLSFQRFWKELPIDNYLASRESLIFWVYALKNKVNAKLRSEGQHKRDASFNEVLNYVNTKRYYRF